MVKFDITQGVKHDTNEEYFCMLVQFEPKDNHFHETKQNWMPTSREAYTMFTLMMAVDNNFRWLVTKYFDDHKKINQTM